jgi:hypothetical protein
MRNELTHPLASGLLACLASWSPNAMRPLVSSVDFYLINGPRGAPL